MAAEPAAVPGANLSCLLLRRPARAFEALKARPWDRRALVAHWLFTAALFAVLGSYFWSRMLLASHALHIFGFWLGLLALHGGLLHLFARALKGHAPRTQGLAVALVSWLPIQLGALALVPAVAARGFEHTGLFNEPYIGIVPALALVVWFFLLQRVGVETAYGLSRRRARLAVGLVALSFAAILIVPHLLLQPDVFLFFVEARFSHPP